MVQERDIASTAALFGDPARAAMLIALLDRPVLAAGELALAANISPQTASFHLAKLTSAALLKPMRRGRNQLYRLSGAAVAGVIESLAAVSPGNGHQGREGDRFQPERMRQLRAARTCYDHLAGIAGVLFHDSLLRLGYLRPMGPTEYRLTAKGQLWFSRLGGTPELLRQRSPFARRCVDWTEKQPHLAGRLAAFLLDRFFIDGWIARIHDTRAIRFPERGLRGFEREYGVNFRNSALI